MSESSFKKAVELSKKGNYMQAINLFTQIITQQPSNYSAYLNRGSMKLCINQFNSAIEDFNNAIRLEPFEITAYYNRFITNYKLGSKPQARIDIYITLSLCYTKRGQELKMVKLLNKAINLVENNVLAYLKRGNFYRDHNNYVLAENDYTGALEHDTNNIAALSARASLYKLDNKQQQAEEDVQRLSELMKLNKKSNIKLAPKVESLKGKDLELDIQNKLRQFKQLRTLLFKLDQQHPIKTSQSKNDVQVKNVQDSQNEFRIFNSFNDSSNNPNTNPYITYKGIQIEDKVQENNSTKLKQPSLQISKNQIDSHNSHITEKSQQYKAESLSQLQPNFNKTNNPPQETTETESNIPDQNMFQKMFSIIVAPYSKLQIMVISANLERDTQLFGKMSPYVECCYNGWIQKTEVATKAGKHPKWNQGFKFNYIENIDNISFKVFDKETFKNDDLVCETNINIKYLLSSSELRLYYKKKDVGILKLKTTILETQQSS